MVCTYCGGETKVTNSRHQKKSNQVWRRRQCLACGATFSTSEAVDYELAWLVSKGGKALRPFSRDKLFLSLYDSCAHRKTALSDARGLTETVISKLTGYLSNGTLQAGDIARAAQVALNRFDKAASVHYRARHP
jgi:transcriptional repressor NrdR